MKNKDNTSKFNATLHQLFLATNFWTFEKLFIAYNQLFSPIVELSNVLMKSHGMTPVESRNLMDLSFKGLVCNLIGI